MPLHTQLYVPKTPLLVKKPTRQSRPVPVAVVERLPRVPARVSGSLYNKKKRRRGKKEEGEGEEEGKREKKKEVNQKHQSNIINRSPKSIRISSILQINHQKRKKKKRSKNLPELMGGGWLMGISFVLMSMLSCGARRKGRKRSGERNRGGGRGKKKEPNPPSAFPFPHLPSAGCCNRILYVFAVLKVSCGIKLTCHAVY
jgi:hypothetical protein